MHSAETSNYTVRFQLEDPHAGNDCSIGRYLRSTDYLGSLLSDDRMELLEAALLPLILQALGKAFQMC